MHWSRRRPAAQSARAISTTLSAFDVGMRRMGKRFTREELVGVSLLRALQQPTPREASRFLAEPQNRPNTILEFAYAQQRGLRPSVSSALAQAFLSNRHIVKRMDNALLTTCLENCDRLPRELDIDLDNAQLCRLVFEKLEGEHNIADFSQAARVCLNMLPNARALELLCHIPILPDEPVWDVFCARKSDGKWDRVPYSDALLARVVRREFDLGNFRFVADLFRGNARNQTRRGIIAQTCSTAFQREQKFSARMFLAELLPVADVAGVEEEVQDVTNNFKLFRDTKLGSANVPKWEKRRAMLNVAFESFENEQELLHEVGLFRDHVAPILPNDSGASSNAHGFIELGDVEVGFALKHLYLQPQATDRVHAAVESLLRELRGNSPPPLSTYSFFLHEDLEESAGTKRWNAFHSIRSLAAEPNTPKLSLSKACKVWRKLEDSQYVLHAGEEHLLYELFRQVSQTSDDAAELESWLEKSTYSRSNSVAMAGYFARNDEYLARAAAAAAAAAPTGNGRRYVASRWDLFKRLFKTPLLKDTPASWRYVQQYVVGATKRGGALDLAAMHLLLSGLRLQTEKEGEIIRWFMQEGLYQKVVNELTKPSPLPPSLGVEAQRSNAIDLAPLLGKDDVFVEQMFDWKTEYVLPTPRDRDAKPVAERERLLLSLLAQVFYPWVEQPSTTVSKPLNRVLHDLAAIVERRLRESSTAIALPDAALLCRLAGIATLQEKRDASPPVIPVTLPKQVINDMKSKSPMALWRNDRVAQLALLVATTTQNGEERTRNRQDALALCFNLVTFAPTLSARAVERIQRVNLLALHPNSLDTVMTCFYQISILQGFAKPQLSLVDLKFVLKTIGLISVSEESKPIHLALQYLNNIFATLVRKNRNEMLLEPLFDRCIDTLLKKMQRDFPKFKQDDASFLPAVRGSFELMSKILEFSSDNLPGYQYKVFSQKRLAEFCLQQFLNPHQDDYPVEIMRQVFVVLQNLFAFERRISTDICTKEELDYIITKLDWAISHPQVKQNEDLALAVMNAYFALIHANPEAYLELVGRSAVEQLEKNVKRIELRSFEFHSRGYNMSFEEFSTMEIYLVSEEFRDFLTKLAKRG